MLTWEYSSSSELLVIAWTAHWRALGFEDPIFLLQAYGTVYIYADLDAFELRGSLRVAT